MRWVVDELRAGRLSIGDRLPSERTLSETLGVSRSSLREALRILESLGAISSATGSGPNSGTVITASPERALATALDLQLATRHVRPAHVYELRLLLETAATRGSHAAEVDWGAVDALLDAMDAPGLSANEFLRLDAQFHVELSQGSGNPLLAALMSALRSSIEEHTASRANSLPDWPATAERLRGEHRRIGEALRAGKSDEASDLLLEHIRRYYEQTSASRD